MNAIGVAKMTDPRSRIRAYLTRVVPSCDLEDNADIFESGIVKSFFAVELISFTEQEFEIEIEDEDLDLNNFRSIASLAAFVERKMKDAGAKT